MLKKTKITICFIEILFLIGVIILAKTYFPAEIDNNLVENNMDIPGEIIPIDKLGLEGIILRDDKVLTINSDRSYIDIPFEGSKPIENLLINIKEMSVEILNCQIVYNKESDDEMSIEHELRAGMNAIYCPENAYIKELQIQFNQQKGAVINVEEIKIILKESGEYAK